MMEEHVLLLSFLFFLAADSANCELTDVGSGAHLYVCKQDSYPQGEVFGQPLETAVSYYFAHPGIERFV